MADLNTPASYPFPFEDFTFSYAMSGTPTQADVGKVVALDTTKTNTVKLAGDGDAIFGRLEALEDRSDQRGGYVAAVARKFKNNVEAVASHGLAVGDTVTGGGDGKVKKISPATIASGVHKVIEVVGTTGVVVESL